MTPQSAYFPGVLYSHFSECDLSPWPNFSFRGDKKLYCTSTKQFYLHKPSMDALQKARDLFGRPIMLNSGHRSPIYNAMVRGAPRSSHKFFACDIDFARSGYSKFELAQALLEAGWSAMGMYNSFIHVDMSRKRFWYGGRSARSSWESWAVQNLVNRK